MRVKYIFIELIKLQLKMDYNLDLFKSIKRCVRVQFCVEPPDVTYLGDDPRKAPDGTEWRGKGSRVVVKEIITIKKRERVGIRIWTMRNQ